METLESYCSPTANLFAHLFIFCTVLCLSRVEYPGGISHQQPKAVWAAADCKKKKLQSILVSGWQDTNRLENWMDWCV